MRPDNESVVTDTQLWQRHWGGLKVKFQAAMGGPPEPPERMCLLEEHSSWALRLARDADEDMGE